MTTAKYSIFSKEDLSGFWALFADNLANIIIITGLCKGILKMPDEMIFGRVIPGIGVALLFGLAIYARMAVKLARREGRNDVTALPYGISTPVMFVYFFGVMAPVYFKTGSSLAAWQVGIAAAFIGGLLEMLGGFLGPLIQKHTPRAGMLGTLAGIAIVWIGTIPFSEIFELPIVGFVSLSIILMGLVAGIRLPLGIPAGLAAILAGTAIAFATGHSKIVFDGVGFYMPWPYFGDLLTGLKLIFSTPAILAVVIPIEVYNFIETMNNVESAEAAGDRYDVRKSQMVDGLGTLVGGVFGSPFPTTVYIGHPAYKRLGSRCGYALGVGLVFFVGGIFGLNSFLYNLIPVAAVAPMLVFVAIVITAQAYICVKPEHALAVSIALVPHVADLVYKQVSGTLSSTASYITANYSALPDGLARMAATLSAGTVPDGLQDFLLDTGGIHFQGLALLSRGAIITGLLWGAICAFLIDGRYRKASFYSLIAALLVAFGFIHSSQIGLRLDSPYCVSYLLMAGLFYLCYRLKLKSTIGDFSEMMLKKEQ